MNTLLNEAKAPLTVNSKFDHCIAAKQLTSTLFDL